MDAEILHRIQFAFTLTFHYIYPPLSIGISLALIFFKGMYLKTKDPAWERLTKFWIRVFALTFALGVASGIPLVFSLGTNWARYSRFVGNVLGSILAAEGIFAFAMEAGFLGILLFGWEKVSSRMHFLATLCVSFGAHFSAIWITCANAWMQTPAGYTLMHDEKGFEHALVTDWWSVVLNHSSIPHLLHVLLAAWMTGAFLIISISSYYLLKKRHIDFAIKSMKIALMIAAFSCICQMGVADWLARVIAQHNPVKFAAFEGVFKTEPSTKAYAFGWVDTESQTVHGLALPGLLSFLVHRDFTTPVPGLDQAPSEMWPALQAVFQVYHTMVGMAVLLTIAVIIGLWMWKTKGWTSHPRCLQFLVISSVFPHIANIAGWYSSCLGRQPWLIHKLLLTKDGYSSGVTIEEAWLTLSMFVIIYLLLFAVFIALLDAKIKHGPEDTPEESPYRDPFKQHL